MATKTETRARIVVVVLSLLAAVLAVMWLEGDIGTTKGGILPDARKNTTVPNEYTAVQSEAGRLVSLMFYDPADPHGDNGKAMVYEDNTVKVIPNRPRENMVKPVRRWGYYSIDNEGYIVVTPRARKDRSRAIRLKSTMHGSLSKTADGAFLLMMKVYEDEAIDFKTVMKKEIKEALK